MKVYSKDGFTSPLFYPDKFVVGGLLSFGETKKYISRILHYKTRYPVRVGQNEKPLDVAGCNFKSHTTVNIDIYFLNATMRNKTLTFVIASEASNIHLLRGNEKSLG